MPFQCNECGAQFSKKNLLQQHHRTLGHRNIYACDICQKSFGRLDNLRRHYVNHKDGTKYHCEVCGKFFNREDNLLRHLNTHHIQHGGRVTSVSEDKENEPPTKKIKLAVPDRHYEMRMLKEVEVPKFNTKSTQYRITFKELDVRDIPDILHLLKQLFESIIQAITEFMESSDLVRVSLQCPDLDYPIALPFMKLHLLTPERILSEIERVLQSHEEFTLDDRVDLDIVHVALPKGGVGKSCRYIDLQKMMKDKRCFIRIINTDNLCCARALVTAKAKIDRHERWNSIRAGCKIQEILAKDLHESAEVPLIKCGIQEIQRFQKVMSDYQINVVSKEHFNALIFSGPEGGKPIYLYLHDGHYDVITSMPAFLRKKFFCTNCKTGYDRKTEHQCNNPCPYCRHVHDEEEANERWIHCKACNRSFKNRVCYEFHRRKTERGKTTCETIQACEFCNITINRSMHTKPHQCGETYCKTCKEFVSDDHECYMQIAEPKTDCKNPEKKLLPKTFIFFDFESTQEELLQCEKGYQSTHTGGKCYNCKKATCGSYVHRPNLCVVQKVCEKCMHKIVVENSTCSICGENQHIFKGKDTVNSFCKWLFSKENYGAKVLCHNLKGYDSYPIMQYLYENGILPEVITNGTKFMSIDVSQCKMRFLDSLNFLPMPLADLPGAFGFDELCKGYFPHLYNTDEYWNAHLTGLPDISFYHPEGMKPDKRKAFLEWYDKHKFDKFVFQDELLRYCISDVDILRRSCLKFREMFRNITKREDNDGIDPFDRCITIASACNLVFRTLFLQHESIGIIPSHGYRPQYKQSIKAMKWLKYLAETKNLDIQHALNGGEKQIGPYRVDGYYEKDGERVVLEFNGDFWHGCPKCYSKSTINPVHNIPMSDLFQRTQDKRLYLEQLGYRYESIWECDFDKKVREDPVLRSYIDTLNLPSALEPREAFFGGRTEAFKLFAEANVNTRIHYYDVTSLYPYINKFGKIPLGHPEIITENFEDISSYEGLIKCRVLPPRNLYIPALPYRTNNKLVFPLCRTCADNQKQEKCEHSDEQRELYGTWVSDELKRAIEKGYKVTRVDEVWHFSTISQYDPETKEGGIFTEYVNTFLKIKQEASGWPKWCTTEELKQKYIDDYYQKEGIGLDPLRICKNAGLRRLAKLMLNSFWGKFGQRTNLIQNKYTMDALEYFEMLSSDNITVKDVKFVSDEMVQMDWIYENDFIQTSEKVNVVIAAYTTAQARLKLQSYLDQLGNRVLYCDTDSVVFTVSEGDEDLPLGDYLGDLTNEVPDKNITSFVTGGPKNYAYEVQDGPNVNTYCKVRGITLNYKNSLDINYETVKDMVKGVKNKVSVIDQFKIARDVSSGNIITKVEKKDYKLVFDKRVITEDFDTHPYGM